MGVIAWIVLGALAGWVASLIVGTDERQGALGNIVVGIIGALIGGFVVTLFGGAGVTGFNVWSFLVALLGSVLLLGLMRAVTGPRHITDTR